jgi:replicative DNA helicase
MKDLIEQIKKRSEDIASQFLDKDNKSKGLICPYCKSGSGKHGTGLTYYQNTQQYQCWACNMENGKPKDIIDLYARKYNIPLKDSVLQLGRYLGLNIPEEKQNKSNNNNSGVCIMNSTNNSTNNNAEKQDSNKENFLEDCTNFVEIHNEIQATELALSNVKEGNKVVNYLRARGFENLTNEDLEKYSNIGYDQKHNGIMFVYDRFLGVYNTRKFVVPEGYGKCHKSKRPKEDFDNKTIWNYQTIEENDVIFITEGEIDCLTVQYLGFNAISFGSTTDWQKNTETLFKRYGKSKKWFIVLWDNDPETTDNKGNKKLGAGVQAKNDFINYYKESNYIIAPEIPKVKKPNGELVKDINDLLQADSKLCFNWLNELLEQLRQYKDIIIDIKERLANRELSKYNLSTLKSKILTDLLYRPSGIKLKGKFENWSNALGGLQEGINILGGVSGGGKTTFGVEVLEQIAKQGVKCLFISTEMGASSIIARSMSRYALEQRKKAVLANSTYPLMDNKSIRNTDCLTDKEIADKKYIFNGYLQEVQNNITIVDGINNWNKIYRTVEQFQQIEPDKPHFVLLDFLQNVMPSDENDCKLNVTTWLTKVMGDLKILTIDYGFTSLVISSINRESEKNNPLELEISALRDCHNIGFLAESVTFIESGEYKKVKLGNEVFTTREVQDVKYPEPLSNIFTEEEQQKQITENLYSILSTPIVDYIRSNWSIVKNRYGEKDVKCNMKYYKAFSHFEEVPEKENDDVFSKRKRKTKIELVTNKDAFIGQPSESVTEYEMPEEFVPKEKDIDKEKLQTMY